MSSGMRNATLSGSPGRAVLCSCNNYMEADLQQFVERHDAPDFDAFLMQTGVGNKCTACLLDVEYRFCELTFLRARALPANARLAASGKNPKRISLRHRFYRLIDGIAPKVSMGNAFNSVIPVVRGNAIEQFAWISNRSRLFAREPCGPPLALQITIRDAGGRVLSRLAHRVEPEQDLRVNLSEHVPAAPSNGDPIVVGSATFALRWDRPGTRGTTRPQVEIVSKNGSCSVHTQAPGIQADMWLTLLWRPATERIFFLMVNGDPSPAEVEFTYPIVDSGADPPAARHQVAIPAMGTRLYELQMSSEASRRLDGGTFAVRYRCTNRYKPYLLVGSPDLNRLSIDHV